jgi:hypothetical protein
MIKIEKSTYSGRMKGKFSEGIPKNLMDIGE